MTKPRVHETAEGIQGEFNVEAYDEMQRTLRDRGWTETKLIVTSGIGSGHALEVGPGPGYMGLEWLKNTSNTLLTGVDISPDMVKRARNNAEAYGLADRVDYVLGDAARLPFDDDCFEGVFSNGSLHEWERPERVLREMMRVLKPGCHLLLSDLRRDMLPPVKWFLWLACKPASMREGLLTSIRSSYTPKEAGQVIAGADLQGCVVTANLLGLAIVGTKPERPPIRL